jgi:prepilin peptidase dependent protein B
MLSARTAKPPPAMAHHARLPAARVGGSAAQRGLGLVEIMVALALGLFLIGSGAALVLGQLRDQRQLLLESRLRQDLRAVADLIVRDLKRAGHWGAAQDGLWHPEGGAPAVNPYAGTSPAAGTTAASLGYAYSRDAHEDHVVSNTERFGVRLNPNTRALELRLAGAALLPATGDQWQALTDPALVRITRWQVTVQDRRLDLLHHCAVPTCPSGGGTGAAGTAPCPPRLLQHLALIELDAADARDPRVRTQWSTRVRLRNDVLQGACPAAPGS